MTATARAALETAHAVVVHAIDTVRELVVLDQHDDWLGVEVVGVESYELFVLQRAKRGLELAIKRLP